MRRPVGVIITCIILGFAALSLLVSAAGSLIFMTVMGQIPMPVQPGQPAPDPATVATMMHATMIVLALFKTALAAWAIATLVGLARMKNWARYSVMVIGGGLTLIGIVSVVGLVFAQAFVDKIAQQPGQDPTHIRIVMIIGGVFFYLGIAAIGIWWLTYFAVRRTREAFALAAHPQPGHLQAIAAPLPPSPYAASTYQVASYIPPHDPAATPIIDQHEPAVPMSIAPPARPLAVTIIAWLLIAGGAFCLPFTFLPLPLFIFGTTLAGWPAHLTMICFAVISVLTGLGLLRLEKIALYAAYAFYGFGILNSLLFLQPSVRNRMVVYQQSLMQKLAIGMPLPMAFDNHTMGLMMLPGILIGVLFCAALIALLFYYRAAFNRPR